VIQFIYHMGHALVKIFKMIAGILLLPFCVGAVIALYRVLIENGSIKVTSLVFFAGIVIWTLVYIFLPTPRLIYVFGHEMTHTIWSWFFGGKLKGMKVSALGGQVLTTKSNFITSLAPYFFPFYAVVIMTIFAIGNIFWDWSGYTSLFYFLIGLAYAFHITLTFFALKTKQTDISDQGYVFSTVIIFLGNILILLVGITLFSSDTGVFYAFDLWLKSSTGIITSLLGYL